MQVTYIPLSKLKPKRRILVRLYETIKALGEIVLVAE